MTSSQASNRTNTVSQLIDARADAVPKSTALIDRGRIWTYAELAAESRRLAGGLLKLGIGSGDRVCPVPYASYRLRPDRGDHDINQYPFSLE